MPDSLYARMVREAARRGPMLINMIGPSELEARLAAELESRLGPAALEASRDLEAATRAVQPRPEVWRTEYMGEFSPPPEPESIPLQITRLRPPTGVEPMLSLDWTRRQKVEAPPKPERKLTRFEREFLVLSGLPGMSEATVSWIAHVLAHGPLTAEGVLTSLRAVRQAPKGSDPLGQIRYRLAQNRDLFELVPGNDGLYRLRSSNARPHLPNGKS